MKNNRMPGAVVPEDGIRPAIPEMPAASVEERRKMEKFWAYIRGVAEATIEDLEPVIRRTPTPPHFEPVVANLDEKTYAVAIAEVDEDGEPVGAPVQATFVEFLDEQTTQISHTGRFMGAPEEYPKTYAAIERLNAFLRQNFKTADNG